MRVPSVTHPTSHLSSRWRLCVPLVQLVTKEAYILPAKKKGAYIRPIQIWFYSFPFAQCFCFAEHHRPAGSNPSFAGSPFPLCLLWSPATKKGEARSQIHTHIRSTYKLVIARKLLARVLRNGRRRVRGGGARCTGTRRTRYKCRANEAVVAASLADNKWFLRWIFNWWRWIFKGLPGSAPKWVTYCCQEV